MRNHGHDGKFSSQAAGGQGPPGARDVIVGNRGLRDLCRRCAPYFAGAEEEEYEFRRLRESRRSFATAELSDEKVKAIGASCRHLRHKHLDEMPDPK